MRFLRLIAPGRYPNRYFEIWGKIPVFYFVIHGILTIYLVCNGYIKKDKVWVVPCSLPA